MISHPPKARAWVLSESEWGLAERNRMSMGTDETIRNKRKHVRTTDESDQPRPTWRTRARARGIRPQQWCGDFCAGFIAKENRRHAASTAIQHAAYINHGHRLTDVRLRAAAGPAEGIKECRIAMKTTAMARDTLDGRRKPEFGIRHRTAPTQFTQAGSSRYESHADGNGGSGINARGSAPASASEGHPQNQKYQYSQPPRIRHLAEAGRANSVNETQPWPAARGYFRSMSMPSVSRSRRRLA